MNSDDQRFLQMSIQLAREHVLAGDGGPFGAVVARDGEVIATGWNRVTSTKDPTAHAEMVAIRNAAQVLQHFSLQGCTIYASCEPCPMCLAASYWARVDRVFFAASRHDASAAGFDDEFLYRELVLPVEGRSLFMRQHLAIEGAEVFHDWETKMDKVRY